MPVAFLETLATDLLEHENLVGASLVIHHCSLYHCTFHIGGAHLYLTLIVEEENLVELNVGAFALCESLDEDFVASFNFELLACNFYDCEHYNKTFLSFNRKRLLHKQLFINGLTAIKYFRTAKIAKILSSDK